MDTLYIIIGIACMAFGGIMFAVLELRKGKVRNGRRQAVGDANAMAGNGADQELDFLGKVKAKLNPFMLIFMVGAALVSFFAYRSSLVAVGEKINAATDSTSRMYLNLRFDESEISPSAIRDITVDSFHIFLGRVEKHFEVVKIGERDQGRTVYYFRVKIPDLRSGDAYDFVATVNNVTYRKSLTIPPVNLFLEKEQ